MTTARYDGAELAPSARTRSHGALRRAFSRMISAREAQARRAVNGYLLSLDDATLATYGYSRTELERASDNGHPF